MLKCENISCERGGKLLFKDLSFSIKAGEVVIVKGSNGSGKTSLLSILTGLHAPASGAVVWERRKIEDIREKYNEDIVYIGHKNGIKKYQTVRDNLEFWTKTYDADNRISDVIKFFGFEKVIDLPCYALSAGWQRKVSLSRLHLIKKKLWILDEPLSHVDESGNKLFKKILDLHIKNGGMAIISDHNIIKYGKNLYLNSFAPRKKK